MRLKKLIKRYIFEESNRKRITLGPDVRLNPTIHRLQLKADSDGFFSTAADLFAKTFVANPNSVKQWIGFQVLVAHPLDDLGEPITRTDYRLSDGTDEFFWNGSNWVVNTTSWNTEEDVADNIGDFPVTSKKLQIVINLVTPDKKLTPEVEMIKVLYTSDVEHQEDYIYRTLVRELRAKVRPISDYLITMIVTTDTIDLANDFPLEAPYNIVDIDSVFNDTDDPDHFVDLFSAFDVGTQVITLTSAVTSGKRLLIKFIYQPQVAVTTSAEYSEVAKVPAVIVGDINMIDSAESGQSDSVVNKSDNSAVKIPAPLQLDIEFTVRALTDSAQDQQRLADELKRFFGNNLTITSLGLDEAFRLWLISEYDMTTIPSQNEIHSGRLRARIVNAVFFDREPIDTTAVAKFSVQGDLNAVLAP